MTTVLAPLDYFQRHQFALFPCAWGTKRPLIKWKDGSTADPAAWSAWQAENSNLAVDCAKSGLIVLDIDSSKVSREEAWSAYARLATSWGLSAPPAPMTQSARGGWHVPFRRPADIAPTDLRGGGTLVKISDLRPLQPGEDDGEVIGFKNRGYCVAAGSILSTGDGDLPYLFYPEAPAPHDCPAELIELLRLPIVERTIHQGSTGAASPTDVSGLVAFLDSHAAFDTEPEWFTALGAIKLACGDTEEGLLVARQITREDATEEALLGRWNRLASSQDEKPNVRMLTVGTWIKRAKELGWKGRVGKTAAQMFANVPGVTASTTIANMATAAGATAPISQATSLAGNTQRIIANQGEPYLSRFFQTIHDVPISPRDTNHPNLPDNLEELYPSIFEAMRNAITRIVVMAETPRTFKQQRVMRVLGVLAHMHAPTCQALVDYIHGLGAALSKDNLTSSAKDFEKEISAAINSGRTAFYCDNKGKPDPAVSDNVGVFLNLSNHRSQFDTFGRKVEIAHSEDQFVHFNQDQFDRLWMMAKSIDYNYHPAENVLRTGVRVEARKNQYDSLEDEVQRLGDMWDGLPRLDTWLSATCNVVDDVYHQTVGRNLIGGMVKRARAGENGVKHDEVVIFISPQQGTGKSTIANILARHDEWFLGKFKFGQSDQSSLPLLAGKWIVELGELAGLSKTDFEDVKSFLAEKIDTYVAKYEVLPTVNPRRCIFVGTSNLRQPLADPSGNRRFLPVHVVGKSNLDWLRANIDQIIGEAARRHAAGETFGIPEELWPLTAAAQESARAMTAVEEAIYDWFDREGAFYVQSGDIGRALKMIGLPAQSRYGVYMEKLGWESTQLSSKDRTRVWRKRQGAASPLALEPAQMQANGRVEMRVRQPMATTVAPQPPIPGR
jgi:predicted P-loop ATPase